MKIILRTYESTQCGYCEFAERPLLESDKMMMDGRAMHAAAAVSKCGSDASGRADGGACLEEEEKED